MRKEFRNKGADHSEDVNANALPTNDFTAASSPSTQSAIASVTEDQIHDAQSQLEHDHLAGGKPISRVKLYARRFVRNKMAVVGTIVFFLLVLFAIFGPLTAKYSYDYSDFAALGVAPNSDHWFGTSASGNDMYAMVIQGLSRSLVIAVIVSTATTILSALIGTTAALLGGRPEKAILGLIHFLLVVPTFLILALLVSGSGGDWKILIVVLIAFGWMFPARVIWSMTISVREREYVKAARYMGVSNGRIVVRHLVPNIGSLLVINLTLGVVSAVMSETGLSFLGLGVKMPDVSLGTLLSTGAASVQVSPWEFYFPAAVLTLLTVSMAFVADGLRDALDPNSAAAGKA
ncbi:Oligopeptide transport system permease protein OppC [Corynebacterium ciconiae DSM 44920]|uniref:ABC transporter permease n=1 Tax=Corynebacterium ciconiae TaxID=227319 RepID=UPI0003718BEB|nr:ABC transporter permease [Corynebacterium ciconiae]WKD60598.1 Oligopeptide transport system permease protein OppC [Corynebacterium ciconiae DSM 44920]